MLAPELRATHRRNPGPPQRKGAGPAAPPSGRAAASMGWRRRLLSPSDLFQVDQEGLELGGARVRVADKGCECVGHPVPALVRVTVGGYAGIAPMDGDADLIYGLAGDLQGAKPFGHQREHLDLAALGGNPDLVARLDALGQ